ncbi:crAss001_48 related protein [Burkholderia ubonensis]|uniref:crAss001_48 related protein n=1 Tax=Burkholderia ubonensis TaxID=101571 RepID=UPI000B024BBB|nr:hypothetical protein [Burkholderia ubonensis]
MIAPTIGRVVWFQPAKPHDQPLRDQPFAALVTYVWNDRMVNLAYFEADGTPRSATSVALLQDDDTGNVGGYYAEWMPFQKGQAAKAEKAASVLAPHQQRVVDEKAELDERLSKLNAFFGTPIFTGLDENERERLSAQARVMGEYSSILGDRIAAF